MNIFTPKQLVPAGSEEIETLLESRNVIIERILSNRLEKSEWFNQSEDEWVVLLRGSAVMEFDDQSEVLLGAGDYLYIPAHQRHRILHTSDDTLWLAIHIKT